MPQRAAPLVLGIAGGTGSGKTTVATVILERVGAENIALLPHDACYKDLHDLPPAQRTLVNFGHPDSLETDLLVEHLRALRAWQPVDIPVYDFTAHARTAETRRLEPQPGILVEGIAQGRSGGWLRAPERVLESPGGGPACGIIADLRSILPLPDSPAESSGSRSLTGLLTCRRAM